MRAAAKRVKTVAIVRVKMLFFFDVDDTLIHQVVTEDDVTDVPITATLAIVEALALAGHTIHVGSGGGIS